MSNTALLKAYIDTDLLRYSDDCEQYTRESDNRGVIYKLENQLREAKKTEERYEQEAHEKWSRHEATRKASFALLQVSQVGKECKDLVDEIIRKAVALTTGRTVFHPFCSDDGAPEFLIFIKDVCSCFEQASKVLNLAEMESLAFYFHDCSPGSTYMCASGLLPGAVTCNDDLENPAYGEVFLWKEVLEIVHQFNLSGFEPDTEISSEMKYTMGFTKTLRTVDGKYRCCMIWYDGADLEEKYFTVALVTPWDFHEPDAKRQCLA
jgi:hypothetical protein